MPVQRPTVPAALAAALFALGLGACAPGPAPSWEPLPARIQSAVRLTLSAPAGTTPAVAATLADGLGERRLDPGDFRRTDLRPSPHTAWHPAAGTGTLQVRVDVSGAPGEALATGSLSLPLEAGWLWEVEALVHRPAAGIPAPPCFNCDYVARVPLRPWPAAGIAAGDSLFLRAARTPARGRPPLPPS